MCHGAPHSTVEVACINFVALIIFRGTRCGHRIRWAGPSGTWRPPSNRVLGKVQARDGANLSHQAPTQFFDSRPGQWTRVGGSKITHDCIVRRHSAVSRPGNIRPRRGQDCRTLISLALVTHSHRAICDAISFLCSIVRLVIMQWACGRTLGRVWHRNCQ